MSAPKRGKPSVGLQAIRAEFEAGESDFQKYLVTIWKEYDHPWPGKIPGVDRRKKWLMILRACRNILDSLGTVAPAGKLLGSDLWACSLVSNPEPVEDLLSQAESETEPGYRGMRANREWVFWVSALLPYLVYETGQPRWEWLAEFLARKGVCPQATSAGLQSWWSELMGTMQKRFPKKKLPLYVGIPALPPSGYPPFDASEEFIWFNTPLHAKSPGQKFRFDRKWKEFRVVVFEYIPFFNNLAKP